MILTTRLFGPVGQVAAGGQGFWVFGAGAPLAMGGMSVHPVTPEADTNE
jgi:hypothetical protein